MNSELLELERLAKKELAVVRLTFGHGEICATWKAPGKRAETVRCRGERIIDGHNYPGTDVRGVIFQLLERLDWQGVPTISRFVEKMTSQQRARVYQLLAELKEIRATVEGPIRHPSHASPRSSLHPQHVQGETDPDRYRGPIDTDHDVEPK